MEWGTGQEFFRTTKGMIYLSELICSIIGGIVNVYSGGLAVGLLSFAFWTTSSVTLTLSLMYGCNNKTALEARQPMFQKAELIFVVCGLVVFGVAIIISCFGFGISGIFAIVIFIVMIFDGFLRFRLYRTQSPPNVTAETPAVPPKY